MTNRTPYNVLGKADIIWKESHGSKLFDGSYMSQSSNTSLTKIKHNRFGIEKHSEPPSSEDDELTSDWNFWWGSLGLQVKMNWIEYMPQLTKWICFLMAQDNTEYIDRAHNST
jgi:hypothetical protein